jgi:hypothetical protein
LTGTLPAAAHLGQLTSDATQHLLLLLLLLLHWHQPKPAGARC